MKTKLALHDALHDVPRRALPPGSCDCHTHVFGEPAEFPHALHRQYTPGQASLEELLALHQHLGIDRVVIVQPSPYGADNACTLNALQTRGDRARGVAVIDEHSSDEELARMHALGVRGIRLNLETRGVNDVGHAKAQLHWADQRLAKAGLSNWHIQIYTKLAMVTALESDIQALQRPVVLDHFASVPAALGTAQAHFAALLRLLRDGPAWVKLSAPHRVSTAPDLRDVKPIMQALIDANSSRLVWGTDWPHPGAKPGEERRVDAVEAFNPVNDGRALNRLMEWVDDEALLKAILVSNPARLYDFTTTTP